MDSLVVVNDDCGKGVTVNFDQLSDEENIPELIRKYKTVLRFPEKLMLLMTYVERSCNKQGGKVDEACISWTRDGKALIIRNYEELVNQVLPSVLHGKVTFSSFTRKLYRWGFRQQHAKSKTKKLSKAATKVFLHPHFQRDDKRLMAKMRSTTAERTSKTDLTQDRPVQAVGEIGLMTLDIPHLQEDRRLEAAAGIYPSIWSIPRPQDTLVNRPTAQPLSRELLQLRLRRAVAIADMGLTSSSPPFFPFNGHHRALVSQVRPLVPPTLTYGMESNLLQRVLALDVKQKQAQLLSTALQDLSDLMEQKKNMATVHWG